MCFLLSRACLSDFVDNFYFEFVEFIFHVDFFKILVSKFMYRSCEFFKNIFLFFYFACIAKASQKAFTGWTR